MAAVNTKHLHYQKLPRSFFGEISDLPGAKIPMVKLADGSVGFDLVSHKTGAVITMRAVRSEFNKAGDEIVAYIFEPVCDSRITEVVLLND